MTRTPDNAATVSAPAQSLNAPRFALGWAALVYAACTLALGFPALAGKFLISPPSDQYKAGYPFREFARQYWQEFGAIPQWNPYQYGGMPFVDAMHGDTFYPTAALRILLGTDAGMTWGLIIHIFLAGLFTYVFLRSLGLSFVAALVGGIAYQLGGNVAGLVSPGHDGKIFVATLLPLALLLLVRGIRDGRNYAWGVLAIVVGLAVLSPHPQLLQYMLLMTGAFALFLALGWGIDTPVPRREGMKRLGFALGSVGLGMAMGAIQFLPLRHYVPFSPRSGGKGWEHAVSYSLPPEEIINFGIPQFSGILDNYWGRNGIHLHSDYIGVTVLILAGLAFGAWTLRSHTRLVRFWLGAFIISLLWALGGFTPFYSIIYAIVPGTKFFRAPSTMLYIVSLCTAVLAAFGAERVARQGIPRKYLIGAGLSAIIISVLGLFGGLTNVAVAVAIPERTDAAMANDAALRIGALRSGLFALILLASLWAVTARRLSRDLATTLLALIVATDLWSVLRQYWTFMEPASKTYASNAVIDFMKKESQPFRVFTNQTAPSDVRRDADLTYSGLMAHGVAQVLGYHGNELASYNLLVGESEGYKQIGNPNFWRLANMKYIMTNSPDSMGIPGMRLVAGPARDAAGNQLYLQQLPIETSYAWVAPVIVKGGVESTLNTVLDPRFDVRTAAIFDSSAATPGETQLKALPQPLPIKAHVDTYHPGYARITLDGAPPAGSALVVSENWYPGWRATVDGRPAEVARTDVTFMGIPLAAGSKTIELTFVNPTYETGKKLTWFAVFVALLLVAAGVVVDRRSRVASV
jgi:hypothetical protein